MQLLTTASQLHTRVLVPTILHAYYIHVYVYEVTRINPRLELATILSAVHVNRNRCYKYMGVE